jgi:hypothetical protein
MGERHVEELFSAAYDGVLSDAERGRYEAHVATCARCAEGAEEFRVAVDAVRALPAARMPVRVVLPSTPPVAERRGWFTLPRLPRLSPVWGAGAMAAVGIAAVVVAVHAHGGGGAGSAGTGLKATSLGPLAQKARGGAANQLADFCSTPLAVTTAKPGVTSGGSPPGFSNRVTISIPQRPGEELVLATTGSRYAPGSQVLVFAALTTSSGAHKAVVPCVSLQQGVASGMAAGNTSYGAASAPNGGTAATSGHAGQSVTSPAPMGALAQNGAAAGVPPQDRAVVIAPPLAIAVPTQTVVAGTLTVQVITIPDYIPRGAQLQLVAVVPSGWPSSSDHQPIQAVLTLDVS